MNLLSEAVLASKKRLIPIVCKPIVGRTFERVFRDRLPHRGLRILTESPVVSLGTKARLVWGLYESAETRFVKEYLPINLEVIELGSSLGVVSSHIADKLESDRRLICVEANPELVSEVGRNIRENAPSQLFEVMNAAIDYGGDAEVWFQLHENHVDSQLAALPGGLNSVSVPAVTLSQVIAEHRLDRFALVMDIEGAEAQILTKDTAALENCDFLIAELHESETPDLLPGVDQMVRILETDLGFEQVSSQGRVFAFRRAERPASRPLS